MKITRITVNLQIKISDGRQHLTFLSHPVRLSLLLLLQPMCLTLGTGGGRSATADTGEGGPVQAPGRRARAESARVRAVARTSEPHHSAQHHKECVPMVVFVMLLHLTVACQYMCSAASTKGRSRPPASSLRPGSSCLALSLLSSLPSAPSTARCRVRRLPLRSAPVVGGNCIPPVGQHVVHVGLRQRRAVKFVLLCFATLWVRCWASRRDAHPRLHHQRCSRPRRRAALCMRPAMWWLLGDD
jgi:hypothetical protein